MTDKTTLQAEYDVLAERAKNKREELTTAQTELNQLVSSLVDISEAKERKTLIQKRADLTNLVGALDDELRLLVNRRDTANLAIFEYAEQQAQTNVEAYQEKSRKARLALHAIMDEQRRFLNGGRAKLPRDEGDKRLIELNTLAAKTKAENAILLRDEQRAGFELQRAHNDVEAIRKELVEKPGW